MEKKNHTIKLYTQICRYNLTEHCRSRHTSKKIVKKVERKVSLIRAKANASWYGEKMLKKVLAAHSQIFLNLTAGGWQFWISYSLVENRE